MNLAVPRKLPPSGKNLHSPTLTFALDTVMNKLQQKELELENIKAEFHSRLSEMEQKLMTTMREKQQLRRQLDARPPS